MDDATSKSIARKTEKEWKRGDYRRHPVTGKVQPHGAWSSAEARTKALKNKMGGK